MEWEERREVTKDWLGTDWKKQLNDAKCDRDMSAAFYAFSELGLLGDISIDPEFAGKIWAIVEKVRKEGFPEELCL